MTKNEEKNEDIDFEPEDELGSLGALQAKMQNLRAELERTKAERQEYLDGWQRCKADAINIRRETEERARRGAEMLREALIHDIIPALDSFDLAVESESWANVADGWRSGMERVREQLINALRAHGVERFGEVGDAYDPTLHEIVEERDDIAGESGTVAKVLRAGYKTREKVLRPANVVLKK